MNRIRAIRLANEFQRLQRLERESSLFRILTTNGEPPESYLLSFRVKSLVKNGQGHILEYNGTHLVEIYCPSDYPRDDPKILFLLPTHIFHPNILCPLICLNKWVPSMWLDEICHRIAAVLAYRSFTMDERQSLNKEACVWARNHQDKFPIDDRPLVDRRWDIKVW